MKAKTSLYGILLIFIFSCTQQADIQSGRIEISLSGDDWSIMSFIPGHGFKDGAFERDYPQEKAIPARVPGDIHWDLEKSGTIPYLYYGMNTRDARWVTGKEWWYRKSFKIGNDLAGKTIRLRFEAVDYLADVWLNGHYLGQHEGQFTPFEFEVTDKLSFDQENVLVVQIHPVPEQVRKVISEEGHEWTIMGVMRSAYPYWKSMTSSGWDWGASVVSMGIWQGVGLIATEDVYISNLAVLPQVPAPYDKATLNIRMDLQAYGDKNVKLSYYVRCITANDTPISVEKEATFFKGKHDVKGVVEIKNPELWWPNGYGPQHLYELLVTVSDAESGKPLDQTSATFGIRDLKMLANPKSPTYRRYLAYYPHSPDFPYKPAEIIEVTDSIKPPNYLMQINGRRIMGMGANWLPADLLFGRPGKESYEHLIRLASQANFNLFRIWGGGIIDKQKFFDLCDRYGIMLFAEFPNGGVPLPENDEALEITASETRQILPLLMNHPSIVRYAGGNEWYTNAQNSRQMAQLRQICNEVDPTRPFHDPDPETIGQRHGPHGYEYETHYQMFNTGYPLTAGPDDPFEWNEYGSSGASSLETLKRIMPEESLWPVSLSDPYWIWHKGVNAYGPENWLAPSQYTRLFGQLPDLETTIRCSQFVQAEGLRYANQSHRRNKWHRSAFASWTLNEPWPNAAHGCLVEYYGTPKMAYYYAKKSCAPVDVSCVYSSLVISQEKPLDVEVWVSNIYDDQMTDYELRWRIFNTHGQNVYEGKKNINISGDQSEIAGKILWRPSSDMEGDVALLYLELLDAGEKVIADNLYTFGIQKSSPENKEERSSIPPLKALLHASPTNLMVQKINIIEVENGNIEVLVEVVNSGTNSGLFVQLDAVGLSNIRTYFSDNYFFLPTGQKRYVTVNFVSERSDQISDSMKLSVKAWNSPIQTLEITM